MVDLEAVQAFGEALKKNLQCPICLSLLKNPTSGDCLHKFCKVCIDQQIVIRKKPKCPICNKPISRRSLRETSELTSVLRGVESILTTINSEGAESGSEEPIIPFSQFELTTCKSPEKVTAKVLQKALLTTPLSVNSASNQPPSSTITPAVRSKPGMVANTPARKWNVADTSSSSSRKRKKTAETESHKGALEKNRMLLETIEKGNLGEKSKLKKCSRKAVDITKMESEGDVLSKEATTTTPPTIKHNTDKNKENLVKISLPAPSSSDKKSLLNSEESVAAKSRALQRLMKNVRNVESGRVSNTSLNSTSYQSPKPTSSVGKKVSPFVVKTINKSTPSPDITITNKPVLSSKPGKAVESDEDDSLDIGVKKNKNKKTEIKILSSEEDESSSPTTSSHSSESRRKSLRRKVVKPPIIDDEDSIAFQIPPRDESEPNTIDVLEISFGLRGPSEVFKDSISISNAKTKSKPSKKIDVIKIGQDARQNAVKSISEITNDLDASGESVEMIDNLPAPPEMNQDDDLPSCGFESELSMTFTNEQFKVAEVKKMVKELPKPDLSNVQPQNEAKSLRKSALSRRKADDLKVLETPNLQTLAHSEPPSAPVTPLFCEAIKSSNTVLETPMIPKREAMVLETPVVSMKPKETKKRSIEYDPKDNDKPKLLLKRGPDMISVKTMIENLL
ncbi:breast cancer type 1 susceptibility protein homolog isoform X2 [Bolinopsis microptera]|uniref:breast cancer type 1 susceptibility protein homolog isoform X2 n=1 Tax=Bolinopsis microptera TaxID=2820187 RepID=UPI00307AAFBA